jgi:hypothetical protein
MSNNIYTHKDFIPNKYNTLYFKIISNRKLNIFEGYTESHHIIPRSIGGTDEDINLVNLSAREHFLCHYILKKFTTGVSYKKMVSAFHFMSVTAKNHSSNNRYINSRLFEHSKLEFSKVQSEIIKESWKSGARDDQLTWMKSNSPFKHHTVHTKSMNTRDKNGTNVFVRNNPMHNEESINKKLMSMPNMKGRKAWFNTLTEERRQCVNMPEGEGWINRGHCLGLNTKAKGKPKPRVKCEHCDDTFPLHTMNRHIKAKHNG